MADYTIFNVVTEIIEGRLSGSDYLPILGVDQDYVDGDYDDQLYRIAPRPDPLSLPMPYLYTAEYAQDELLYQIVWFRNFILSFGISHDFGDARGVHQFKPFLYFMDEAGDAVGWNEWMNMALIAVVRGAPTTPIDIYSSTGPVTVTADELLDIYLLLQAYVQPIILMAEVNFRRVPIPQDIISNPIYWT